LIFTSSYCMRTSSRSIEAKERSLLDCVSASSSCCIVSQFGPVPESSLDTP
jgi:hypothetical protein